MDSSHGASSCHANKSANSTLNPFEADSLDSLHLTQFSPSVFKSATPASSKKSPSFRWSIDHLAILHPADINEHPIQQESTLDRDAEERAQQAIEQFFSQQHVVPSPWSSVKRPVKHVTFSPNPPTISEPEEGLSFNNGEERGGNKSQTKEKAEASCQTTLTLPVDFDLQAILGDKFTFEDRQSSDLVELSSSGLRRKLFSLGESSPVISPVGDSPSYQPSPEPIIDIPSPQISPIKQADDTTLSASEISHLKTPGSVQSQFSSSPISTKITPRRWTPYSQGLRTSPTSLMASPAVSPISSTTHPATNDSRCPTSDSHAGCSVAPPCDMMVPDALPLLTSSCVSQLDVHGGMISPYLASMDPSSVDMMPVSFSASGDSPGNGCPGDFTADSKGETNSTSSPHDASRPLINDSISDNDCAADLESPGLAEASVCSMEQSYNAQTRRECYSSQSSSERGNVTTKKSSEVLKTSVGSMAHNSNIFAFDVATHTGIPCTVSDMPRKPILPQSSVTFSILSNAARPVANLDFEFFARRNASQANCDGMTGAQYNPSGSKGQRSDAENTQEEAAFPMQSDSGFNTQSFTSMEVADNDTVNMQQSHEYLLGHYPMSSNENILH